MSGKKGKILERRILKDFHIGTVEGADSELFLSKDHTDVFTHLAKVIGKRISANKKKKDWNALVRKNTSKGDPIGSASEAEAARVKRQSLRKHILENIDVPISIDHDKLIGKEILIKVIIYEIFTFLF